jgi:RimJ/RimL family protein N-acetyltransferase
MNYFNQESERIQFRKLTMNDVDTWTEFFQNNDRLALLGIPDISKDKTEIATEWISMQLEKYEKHGLGHLALIEKSSNEFLGMAGIHPRIVLEKEVFEIAYSLKPKYWGKGFASEAAQQLKKFGLETKISDSFVSIIHKENSDSIKVAQRNEMEIINELNYLGMDVFVFGNKK